MLLLLYKSNNSLVISTNITIPYFSFLLHLLTPLFINSVAIYFINSLLFPLPFISSFPLLFSLSFSLLFQSLFTIKVPDSSHVTEHACMCRHMDIERATRMSKQQSELRIRGDCVSNRLLFYP